MFKYSNPHYLAVVGDGSPEESREGIILGRQTVGRDVERAKPVVLILVLIVLLLPDNAEKRRRENEGTREEGGRPHDLPTEGVDTALYSAYV